MKMVIISKADTGFTLFVLKIKIKTNLFIYSDGRKDSFEFGRPSGWVGSRFLG